MSLQSSLLSLTRRRWLAAVGASLALAACAPMATAPSGADALQSWNDGVNKQRIVDFVKAVTTEGGKDYVAPGDRIAVFDNDGTLWLEYPMYTQLLFVFDRIRALGPTVRSSMISMGLANAPARSSRARSRASRVLSRPVIWKRRPSRSRIVVAAS